MPVSSMVFPLSAVETAVSIINSASRIVAWLRTSMAPRIDRNLLPCRTLLSFRERGQDRACFAARFDDLPLPEILFGEVERFEQHIFHLFVGETVRGLDVDFRFFSASLIA